MPQWTQKLEGVCACMQVTQLGHVKDLATAFSKILGNPKAARQIYNISGERFVTFDGIARACAIAAGAPEPEIVHFNAKEYDFDGKKPFPLRDQHFFTSTDKARLYPRLASLGTRVAAGPLDLSQSAAGLRNWQHDTRHMPCEVACVVKV